MNKVQLQAYLPDDVLRVNLVLIQITDITTTKI
jgi:hypothetical protein